MAGMEFTFKVSEAEYLRAWKLRGGSPIPLVAKIIVGIVGFWAFVFLCFVLLWVVVERSTPRPAGMGSLPPHSNRLQHTKAVALSPGHSLRRADP